MKKYKIIIVENDEDEQHFMREGFDAVGLFTILAQVENGETLFEWLGANKNNLPDIVLSDLNMPGKNGYDIISEMKNDPLYSDIPVVITSTSSTPTIMEKCLNAGAADYMVKPDTFVEYEPFVKELHRRLERISLARKN